MRDRTPLVLLHGFTNTGLSWQPVIAALGESYLPIAPDIRGHGRAGEARPVTLQAVLADIAALCEGRFALAGYSMGGRIALHAALALGERLASLTLIGASPGIEDPAERAARRRADERLAAELEQLEIDALARRWERTPVLADQPPAVRAAAHADRLRNTPAGLARALRGLGTGALPSLWGRLAEVRVPTLLIAGGRDAKFSQLAREMASRLPRAQVAILAGVGHAAHLEAPEEVARLLRRHGHGRDGRPQRS